MKENKAKVRIVYLEDKEIHKKLMQDAPVLEGKKILSVAVRKATKKFYSK